MLTIRHLSKLLPLCGCLALCGATRPASRPTTRPTPVAALAFGRDGSTLFTAHHDSLVIRSSNDGEVRATIKLGLQRITAIALSPDGTRLAIAGGEPGVGGEVLLLDATSGEVLAKAGGFEDLVTSVAFSPDGLQLAAASADRSARLFTVHEGGRRLQASTQLVGHGGPVLAIAFSPDGKNVVTASADRTVKVWSSKDGKLLRTLGNHTAAVQCLAVRPAKDPPADAAAPFSCATGGEDRTVRVWQPAIGRMVRIVRRHEGRVLALAYARDGARLFSAGAEGVVRVIDADSDAILGEWAVHEDWVQALAVSPDGKSVATGDWAGNVRLWELGAQRGKRLW